MMSHFYGKLDDIFYFHFAANDTSGSGDDGASPVADVRLGGAAQGAAPVHSPTPILLTHANFTAGLHEIAITASIGNGYANGSPNHYSVFCSLVVDAQNPSGFVGSFELSANGGLALRGSDGDNLKDLSDQLDTIPTTAMRGTDNASTASALSTHDGKLDTAQTDLDTLTGADGATLATNQGNYAPSKAGDLMGLADDAITPSKYNNPAAYIPYDGGIWIDSAASNTNTVVGVDGLPSNPVSTLIAARTLADAIGLKKYFITNGSALTLAATHESWEFVGLDRSSILNLGSQDLDNSVFINLSLAGTQGGTGFIKLDRCTLTSLLSLRPWAVSCCIAGNITILTGAMLTFDQCFSGVPGSGTPELTFTAGVTTLNFRHYSGGLEVKAMTSDHTMSFETDGQLIINANCTSGIIVARGNMSITDNGTTMDITKDAVWNTSQGVQSVSDDVGITQAGADKVFGLSGATIAEPSAGAPPATPKPQEVFGWLWAHFRNKGTLNKTTGEAKIYNDAGSVIAKGTDTDDGTTFTKGELDTP